MKVGELATGRGRRRDARLHYELETNISCPRRKVKVRSRAKIRPVCASRRSRIRRKSATHPRPRQAMQSSEVFGTRLQGNVRVQRNLRERTGGLPQAQELREVGMERSPELETRIEARGNPGHGSRQAAGQLASWPRYGSSSLVAGRARLVDASNRGSWSPRLSGAPAPHT
jgi:hypothetical protein